ncbi:PAS domain-containing sensor histidine kinase [Actinoplanes sp. ATCC 53533]|uniref:hybrid sensor histidine kinase/response regulator n=1 Tax=Actinoplanes sp. ATCC 53533 TaxID=1288362 RepID=UPI001F221B47|nr:PAS domain-containing hybrid sensor histidine kinase/response regulator [Actinoplanes sp. ATCC 53533]
MAGLAVTALFLLIFVWATVGYLRRRDPLLRDVMLIFSAVAMLFVLSVLRLAVGMPSRTVAGLVTGVLLGQPFFTLRLVSRLRPVPSWVIWGALAAWIASAVPVLVIAQPLPDHVVWPVVTLFFLVEAVAAALLAVDARRRGGAARIRLACAAVGTGLFGATMLLAGAGVAVVPRSLAVVSALMYLLAFMPPHWLRRTWSWGAANALMRSLLAAPPAEPAHRIWQRYCERARQVLGADLVVVLLPKPGGTVQVISDPVLDLAAWRCRTADVASLPAVAVTIDALAGWTDPPPVAADLARISGTRFVNAAPLPAPGGTLLLLHRFRTLFADDDVELFAELASQAAALAERAAVLAERQRLAVIVESSADAIIGKAVDGIITSWNAGAERLYGYRVDEAVGRDAAMLFPEDCRDREAELLACVLRGERVDQVEVRNCTRDGVPVTVSLTSSLIADASGQPLGVACIVRDISERQRAEAMFRGLLEAAPDAIVGVTADGRIALLNAQAERLFGYRRDELLGQSVDILVPERVRAAHPGRRLHYFSSPQPRPMGGGVELAAVRKDGSEFPAEISLSALETDQGVIVSAAVRDVSERLQAQAERERLAAQAEHDAAERRLQHTRRLESLGQLAGGVAHDFNNILAVIASYTELLTETLQTPAPDAGELTAARADLAQIGRATERATRLTKQLLAFGRREITQTQVLSLNHVVGDVEQMLRRTLGEHIHLVTHLDSALLPVSVDPSQFEQILLNLAVNARDAMPGGGTLSIDTSNTELDEDDVADCTELSPGRYVRFRVSDTGSGMPPEVAERAFEPFFTTKPQGAGTGLGLATVYGIATAAGGHVRLYSEAGIGTTITLVLPASDAAAVTDAGAPADAGEPAAPGSREATILLVEDEEALRDASGRILARAGYEVLVADGGAAALSIVQHHPEPIHLLLTDVIMPNMMGNEVAARIHELRPEIPVLYMSGYAQPVLTENGTLQQGVTIIEKPFTRRDLIDRVHARLHHAGESGDSSGPVTVGHHGG